MSSRDAGVLALGRFLAVERYRQSDQPSAHPVRSPRKGRGAGDVTPDSRRRS